jgi:hypothetical protein
LAGDAWVSFAFLLGFALSVILGELWASRDPDTPFNFLCGAIGFAAVASVFLQLYQWLGLTRSDGMTDIWVLYMNDGGRPLRQSRATEPAGDSADLGSGRHRLGSTQTGFWQMGCIPCWLCLFSSDWP